MMKFKPYKYWIILLSFIILSGCLSGKRPAVRLSPEFDKRIYRMTHLPVTVGLYIEPKLRNFVQEASIRRYDPGGPYYAFPPFVFPIGEPLSSEIEEMSRAIFQNVVAIDNLQNREYINQQALDGILSVVLKESDIDLYIETSVGRAISKQNLSVIASFLDTNLTKIWESEIAVEGKGLDVVTSKVEREWWTTTGPNFARGVDDAIQKLTYELAQKITTSKEISDYIHEKR